MYNWWTSDVKLNYSKPVPKKKQTDLHLGMAWRWEFQQIIELFIIKLINSFSKCKFFLDFIGID